MCVDWTPNLLDSAWQEVHESDMALERRHYVEVGSSGSVVMHECTR